MNGSMKKRSSRCSLLKSVDILITRYGGGCTPRVEQTEAFQKKKKKEKQILQLNRFTLKGA